MWIFFEFGIFGYLIYKFAMNSFTDNFIGSNPKRTKAVIIDKKNYEGNQPVKPKFSYSYQFILDGKTYEGNSHDESVNVGDTVEVEYNSDRPGINKPLHPKE